MKKLFAAILFAAITLTQFSFTTEQSKRDKSPTEKIAEQTLKKQIMTEAAWTMQQQPVTVTATSSPRSAGGKHDFFSEADYFWPDPKNPDGAYINRDGMTNPDNFVEHRKAMIRFSKIIGALASAYKITGDVKYVNQAVIHLKAWFIDPETLMNPSLWFAQAVKGQFTGRNYGIIDTIHLMEVAQGIIVMEKAMDAETTAAVKKWFTDYTNWLMTSKPGMQERDVKNNHATCWAMQVASFAKLCKNEVVLDSVRVRYKTILLPRQMGTDGSFPLEMARTKPYGYSIFNLDAMTMLCQILSSPQDNLWNFETPDGKSIKKGISYLYPFVADKSKWTLKPDVMYWDNWPIAQPFLLFGANAYHEKACLTTWQKLDHNPQVEEVIRNLPIRHPLIWF
ncbi:alginate lyase family protein [Mucilaginibacter rubeus]|uniref:Alginate lyase family protein n=1 Tax=Mucilaginibacter rubeus TaxID=2027860 RepID=A0AAE6MJU0_9SPHI|nr:MULTISPECIES: alginate lyase family protein [Mucilaginibacter]QEM06033.1 alginate lyase family protein [Mucilaginibacter rubeus]QEM18614.1 alginate lyase family protein [Mucilaginibacter gossypii]QTE44844.1 alginate lyase family protein [Mucilaginibacter rubeus]QTE51442.1 alginate lyase family protein [Mucilaginibacter rubeus]QTE56528.1 alginate lyase family protein [Mucilaginibacter rubeus]